MWPPELASKLALEMDKEVGGRGPGSTVTLCVHLLHLRVQDMQQNCILSPTYNMVYTYGSTQGIWRHFGDKPVSTQQYSMAQPDTKCQPMSDMITQNRIWGHRVALSLTLFKTASIGHSDTPPSFEFYPKTIP
jgi:hypothetical protein